MSSAAATLMPAWGKGAMLVGLLFGACWGGSIIYWRVTDRMPTAGELAICLVGVPLLLCGVAWLSRRMIDTETATTDKSTLATTDSSVNSHAKPIAILGSALRLPHGSSPAEVCAAIKSAKARPELDPDLRDADGFPVMTFRCADADDTALREDILTWLAANKFGSATLAEEHLRALTLASQVAIELAEASEDLNSLPLSLVPITPRDWTADQVRAAGGWLHAVLVDRCGWAAQRCTVDTSSHEQDTSCLVAAVRDTASQRLTMLLAFDSYISDAMIRRWEDDRYLFTSANPSGRIPGEGAAGMIVAAADGIPFDGRARACIASVEEGILTEAAAVSKRRDPSILIDLMKHLSSAAAVGAREINMIAADTGHQAAGALELFGAKNAVMPHLEDTEDVLRLGASTGYCGAVQSLAALIVAGSEALERQLPTMWVSNEDVRQRAVTIVLGIAQQLP